VPAVLGKAVLGKAVLAVMGKAVMGKAVMGKAVLAVMGKAGWIVDAVKALARQCEGARRSIPDGALVLSSHTAGGPRSGRREISLQMSTPFCRSSV